jgi:RimJ/RimL family protein N-acetyltransferase
MHTDPVLIDLPESLTTDRLVLRSPRAGDGPAVHDAIVESLAELRQWPASLPWALAEPSVAASEAFCRQGHADHLARKVLPLLAFLKDGGTCIGSISLHHLRWHVPAFEIGYWCRTSQAGQGFMTEALTELTRFALSELRAHRVECFTDEANLRSRRLCERVGYQLEGVLRHERRGPDGSLRNTCVYARVA